MDKKRIAFLFPGQGAQYPGMGKDFVQNFSAARLTFEEADDLLQRNLSDLILEGSPEELTQTKNSQVGIYVTSVAILRVVKELYDLEPIVCAGLSLGEYTAMTACEILSFINGLPLVQDRGQFMQEACNATTGAMSVIVGMDGEAVEKVVKGLNLPRDLWVANYNCPGQVVISGTLRGIEAGTAAVLANGAKKVIPLQVAGAFHSGLMAQAEKRLEDKILQVPLHKGVSKLVMNVPGAFVEDLNQIRHNMVKQVTSSVRWEQGIRAMSDQGIDLFIEFGPGKTLSGMNKRIGLTAPTLSVEKIEDLDLIKEKVK